MKTMSNIKRICICGVCIALCYVMPIAFHAIEGGSVFSPMHIPVLLCGLICGGGYGLICGLIGPIISSLLSGMPPATALVSMLPELMTYGLVVGLLFRFIRTRNSVADIYLAMLPAMLAGRIVGGIAKALFYTGGEGYSMSMWVSSYLVGSLPGIIAHLIVIPLLVMVLIRAKLIPSRYGQAVEC